MGVPTVPSSTNDQFKNVNKCKGPKRQGTTFSTHKREKGVGVWIKRKQMCQQLRKWEGAFKGHNKFLEEHMIIYTNEQMQKEM